MPYHPLTNETGGDEQSRVEEAHKICQMLENSVDMMSQKHKDFIEQMSNCEGCTPKQLFYLRDIKDQYL